MEKKDKKESPFDCNREIFGSHHLAKKRAKKFRCRSKRIRLLSQPKHSTPKYVSEPQLLIQKNIEIVRPYHDPLPTRIKLLAFPKVRKLLASRDAYRGQIERERIVRIENLASRSMLTMYSRLANVQMPSKQPQKTKWTREDWARHCEWLRKRACPKREILPPRIKRSKVPLKKLKASIQQLSQPRYYREKFLPSFGFESIVKDSAKLYEPTERIIKLSEPKKLVDDDAYDNEFDPYQVNQNALTYKPTTRIKELATPKAIKIEGEPEESEEAVLPSGVFKRALKATTTPRTVELSKPKAAGGDEDEGEKPNVNPKALKAKASARILQLARPREYPK